MANKGSTAILFFSRTASDEAAAKTFYPGLGLKGNTAISRCLIQEVKTMAQSTQLPFFTSFSPQQSGDCFGERLANAMESVFSQGFKKVIVLGNDCPFVNADMLLQVSEDLENKQVVLGPTQNGGVYLIGLQKAAYQRQDFLALPWQKKNLQSAWRNYARQVAGDIHWLENHFDINHFTDFLKLLKALPLFYLLRKQLIFILHSFSTTFIFGFSLFFSQREKARCLSPRAPPYASRLPQVA